MNQDNMDFGTSRDHNRQSWSYGFDDIFTPDTRDLEPCSSFKAPVKKFSNAIIEDLGDLEDEALVTSRATNSGSVAGQPLRPSASEAENNHPYTMVLLEFWAKRAVGVV
ncbi:hypothetical protein BU17DRAFT_69224 [Hysterangium stoloniferum]|nr:hypothetical protein BU17DRAFT_69224 [Hysterangium stoloniferum]